MMRYFIEIITSFIEVYVYYSVACLIISKNVPIRLRVMYSSIFTALILYMNSFSYFSVFTLLISPIMLSVSAVIVFRLQFRYTLSFSFFYVLILHIFDSILVALGGLISGQQDYVNAVTTMGMQRLVFISIDKTLFFVIYLLLKKHIKSKEELAGNKYLFVISLGGFCGALFLTKEMAKQINLDIVLSWIFLTVAVILTFVVLYFYLQQQREKDSLKFVEMRNELLENNYRNLKKSYEDNSKLFHDLKNHIRVINNLVNDNKIEELKDYISGFELRDRNSDDTKWTEDTVVNFIIINKISLAKQKDIVVNANIDYPLKTNIASSDMTTMLANLFDNAIEACEQIPEGQDKHIDVVIRRINGMLFIKFENSCQTKPLFEKDNLLTIKRDKKNHGWGLKSVKSTVNKYDGSFDFKYLQDKQLFRTMINLSFRELSEI